MDETFLQGLHGADAFGLALLAFGTVAGLFRGIARQSTRALALAGGLVAAALTSLPVSSLAADLGGPERAPLLGAVFSLAIFLSAWLAGSLLVRAAGKVVPAAGSLEGRLGGMVLGLCGGAVLWAIAAGMVLAVGAPHGWEDTLSRDFSEAVGRAVGGMPPAFQPGFLEPLAGSP